MTSELRSSSTPPPMATTFCAGFRKVKGEETDESRAKHQFLAEWVEALNALGGFGRWALDISRNSAEIEGILARHAVIA